jgi:hypothetical protein
VTAPGLKIGDSVTKFERRTAFVGTLGSETDAVIGLVDGALPKKGYRAEIYWTGQVNDAIGISDGTTTIAFNPGFHYPTGGLCPVLPSDPYLLKVCVFNAGVFAQPLVFTLDYAGPHQYSLQDGPNSTPGQHAYTVKVYLDDQLIKTIQTPTLTNDIGPNWTTFGVFP